MSVLDEVRKLEQQVIDRLRELEPLVREYEQLREVAGRLGVEYEPAPPEPDGDTSPAGTGDTSRTRAGDARPASKTRAKRPARKPAAKGAVKPAATRKPAAKTAAKPARSAGGRGSAARPGQRQDDVLRLVAEQPGITVRELGERLGVDSTGLYRIVTRLSETGRVRKDGRGLHPVEPASSTPAATAAADFPDSVSDTPDPTGTEPQA